MCQLNKMVNDNSKVTNERYFTADNISTPHKRKSIWDIHSQMCVCVCQKWPFCYPKWLTCGASEWVGVKLSQIILATTSWHPTLNSTVTEIHWARWQLLIGPQHNTVSSIHHHSASLKRARRLCRCPHYRQCRSGFTHTLKSVLWNSPSSWKWPLWLNVRDILGKASWVLRL